MPSYCPNCFGELVETNGDTRVALVCPHCENGAKPAPVRTQVVAGSTEIRTTAIGNVMAAVAGPPVVEVERPTIGRFRVIRTLGKGGFGTVYLAHDPDLDRQVAIKLPHSHHLSDKSFAERFRREARSAAQLHHPNIVAIHSVEREGEIPFLVCEYVEGCTLHEFIDREKPTFRKVAEIVRDIASALDYAHAHGIVHRDVKTSNILMEANGTPRLTDFGLAKRVDEDITMTVQGQILGTPAYMSPEQASGELNRVGPLSDVYSLGVVLYVMLAGDVPFRGSVQTVISKVMREIPRPPRSLNRAVPRDLQTICHKAMEKEIHRRYKTSGELALDLGRWLDGLPITAQRIGHFGRLIRWGRREPITATLVTAVAMLLTAVTGVSAYSYVRARVAYEREYRNLTEKLDLLNGQYVRQGTAYFEPQHPLGTGNPLAALPYLAEALTTDERNPERERMDRVRLGMTLHASPEIVQMFFEDEPIRFATFDPTGKRVVTCGSGPFARIWDAETGKPCAAPLMHEKPVVHCACSPDGKFVATASSDGSARVWNLIVGTAVTEPLRHGSGLNRAPVVKVRFSPDGNLLATVDSQDAVKIWQVKSGTLACPALVHSFPVLEVDFSPDSKHLLTAAGAECVAHVWDVRTGKIATTFEGDGRKRRQHVHVACYGADEHTAASGDTGGRVFLWDPASGDTIRRLPPHAAPIWSLSFSPDGRTLASASTDGVVKLWNVSNGIQLGRTISHGNGGTSVQFSPLGDIIATAARDGLVALWDAKSGDCTLAPLLHGDNVLSLRFAFDGRRLVTASSDGAARIWDCRPTSLAGGPLVSPIVCATSSSDGRFAALSRSDGTVALASLEKPNDAKTLEGHPGSARCLTFNRTASAVAFGGGDGTACVWTADTRRLLGPLLNHGSQVLKIALSADARRVLTVTQEGRAFLWDTISGRCLGNPVPHAGPVKDLAFSADGTKFATAGGSEVRLWNTETGDQIGAPMKNAADVFTVSFSPDQSSLLCGGAKGATLWDVRLTEPSQMSLFQSAAVRWAAFLPGGRSVVTIDETETAKVMDLADRTFTVPSMRHPSHVVEASFSPDGHLFLTDTANQFVRMWDLETGLLAAPPIRLTDEVFDMKASGALGSIHCLCGAHHYILNNRKPPSESLEALTRVAELRSAHKLDRIAGSLPMSTAELRTLWQQR